MAEGFCAQKIMPGHQQTQGRDPVDTVQGCVQESHLPSAIQRGRRNKQSMWEGCWASLPPASVVPVGSPSLGVQPHCPRAWTQRRQMWGSLSSCSAEGPSHGTGNLASEGDCPTHLTGLLHGPMADFNHPQDPMPFSENSQNLQIPRKANKSERPPISAVVEKHIQEFSVAHSLDAQTHKTRH